MIKIFKFIVFIILLLLLAVTALLFTFDANNYKAEIIEQVEQQTGRDFDIAGDISLSVFPWIGLKVEDVSLGNATGFSNQPMLSMAQLDVKVMVLPLLKKEIQVDKVRLHGLSVSLETSAQGVTNWADLARPAEAPPAAVEQQPVAGEKQVEEAAATNMLAGLAVNGIEFVDASIRWLDARSNMKATVTGLSLETGAIGFDKPVELEFNAHVNSNQPELDASIALTAQLTFNEALNRFSARNLVLEVQSMMQALSKEMIKLEMGADAVVDLQQQSARLSNTRISALGATINAELDITHLDTTPEISGALSSNSIDAKALAASLQIELPPMANANSLGHVSLSSKIKATPSSVALEDFRLELDQSTITGWLRVPDLVQPKVRYQLGLNAIRLDDYLPPVVASPPAEAKALAPAATTIVATGADRVPADIEIALPLDLLRKLDLDGQFAIQQLDVMGIAVTDMVMNTRASQGVVNINPLTMKLLDGEFTAKLRLDVNQLPEYSMTAGASNIHAGPVVNPILKGLVADEEIKLQGAAHFNADIKTRGHSVNALKQAATGQVNFDMEQTSVQGLDLEYFARSVVTGYLDEKKLDVPSEWRGEYQPEQETAFNKIHASATLTDGTVSNRDFIMDSKHIKVTGSGVVNIMNNTMDYNAVVDLTLNRNKTFAEKVLDEPVGVHIHGPFELLAIEPDKKRLADVVKNLLKEKAKAELEQKLEQEKAILREKAEAEKKALQQKLEQEKEAARLKLEQEKEEARQKMQDKLKNKLKGLF